MIKYWACALLAAALAMMLPARLCADDLGERIRVYWKTLDDNHIASARIQLAELVARHPAYSRHQLCEAFLKKAADSFQFQEAARVVVQEGICESMIVEVAARGVVFLSYIPQEANMLDLYLSWLKQTPDESVRMNAMIYVLQRARLTADHYMSLINSFRRADIKKNAFLAFITRYPLLSLIQRYLVFSRRLESFGASTVDQLISHTYEIMRGKLMTRDKTNQHLSDCLNVVPKNEQEVFWQMACAYQAKDAQPELASKAEPFLSAARQVNIFSVMENLSEFPLDAELIVP